MEDFLFDIFENLVNFSLLADLFSEMLLTPLFLSNVFITIAFVVIFYYVINHPRFQRWYHWLLVMGCNFAIIFLIHIFTCIMMKNKEIVRSDTASDATYLFDQGALVFTFYSLEMALISVVIYIVFSYSIKWWSVNACLTP